MEEKKEPQQKTRVIDYEMIKAYKAEVKRKMARPPEFKRGRKAEPEEEYLAKSLKEIKRLYGIANSKDGKKQAKERQMIRNKAAALKSRVEKKLETRFLQNKF